MTLAAFVFLLLLTAILKPVSNHKNSKKLFLRKLQVKLHSYLEECIHYSGFLRLMIESYFQMSLMTLYILINQMSLGTWRLLINSMLAVVTLAFALMVPLIIFIFLTRNKSILKEKNFKRKFSSLYENQRVHITISHAHLYIVLFLL